MKKDKFWKTTVTVTVLSFGKEPPQFRNLAHVAHEIDDGECTGSWDSEADEIEKDEMKALLENVGSELEFLTGGPDEDDDGSD